MEGKSENYFHLAILACTGISKRATPQSNKPLRYLLETYGSFEEAYKRLNLKESPDITYKLREADMFNEELLVDYKISRCIDSDFPVALKRLPQTAPAIYYRGNLGLLERECVTVVGTREELTPEEKSQADKVLCDIVKKNEVIVSGLAIGCDYMAHEAGLASGTVAVLGVPIDKPYIKKTAAMHEKIASEHLLISQFPVGLNYFVHPKFGLKHNLVTRNQTTVALSSKAVVVIKHADGGGTQHAIDEARKLGKELYTLRFNLIPKNTWTGEFEWQDCGYKLLVKAK